MKRSLGKLLVAVAVILPVVLATNPSEDQFNQLARNGKIQENAPVKASIEITVNAPPEKIWSLLTDIQNWPKWQHDIRVAEISGPIEEGTQFAWTTGGTSIHSRIALVRPGEQFGWTGKAFGAKAIHLWKLKRLPDGQTLVRTEESMNGFLITLFYSSKELEASDRRWLDNLKSAAEQAR